MRIDKVVARAFGPFRGEELKLAPGMTVVSGPNEAGKSSWHAALRLALTGLRRGKGPGTLAERQLAERHRPWDQPERWEVEARLRLADGRIIEISQDLAGKVDCRAVDVGLGRDVSHEIMDGTPDASRWLGLTRDAFASTISVSQAQILAVTEAADELQEQMQRAAATHGSDATAAEAITRLEQFRRDAVGVDRVGARGPLRAAKDRLTAVEARLADARRQHDEYLERSAEVEVAERRLADARQAALRAEAHLAAARAAESGRRHAEAAELASRHPRPPQGLAARDARADAVAGALDAWASKPELVELEGTTAAEMERQLADLPQPPTGDLEPHPTVREALRALDLADNALAVVGHEPAVDAEPLPDVSEPRVRELARRLRVPQLSSAARLEHELGEARRAAADAKRPLARPLLVGSGVALVLGLALLAAGLVPLALVAVIAAAGAGAWGWSLGTAQRAATARLARAEAAVRPYREARAAEEADRSAAESEARTAGLPTDPALLDALADRLASASAARRSVAERAERLALLAEQRQTVEQALLHAISERGEKPAGDAVSAWRDYEAACRDRAAQAAVAARREALERQIEARRSAERSASAAAAAVKAVELRLRECAAGLGLDTDAGAAQLAAGLRAWQRERAEELRRDEASIAEWHRLASLLDGATIEHLAERAAADAARAAELAERLGEPVTGGPVRLSRLEAGEAEARTALMAEAGRCDALRGSLEARREALPDVAEAEESVLAARVELRRVEALAQTLDRTLALLRSAEERVHRSLAPVLAAAIGRWLPIVCKGAYVDVGVDPADLAVRVKEAGSGKWREARLLSEGTREQIYLLLRVAMAEHLVVNGETAPLLLDEVTVQSDAGRKAELLDVLHRLSADRQVVLFTHDDDVLAWATRRLVSERDATVVLPARETRPAAAAERAPATPGAAAALPVGD